MKPSAAIFALLLVWNVGLTWCAFEWRGEADALADTILVQRAQIERLEAGVRVEYQNEKNLWNHERHAEKAIVDILQALTEFAAPSQNSSKVEPGWPSSR